MKKDVFRKGLVLAMMCLFIGTSVLPSIRGNVEEKVFDGNPLTAGWKHKTPIELEFATPVDDYQVKIEIDLTNFDYSKVNSDGSDIRFYDLHGNKLSYWIEEWNPDETSIVWVKVLNTGTSTIFLYSCNKEATSESNGDETFIFFDDFKGPNVNLEKWEKLYAPR